MDVNLLWEPVRQAGRSLPAPRLLLLVGVAGIGKTTYAEGLEGANSQDVAFVPASSYLLPRDKREDGRRSGIHPDAFRQSDMKADIKKLLSRKSIAIGQYDRATDEVSGRKTVAPRDWIVLEGLGWLTVVNDFAEHRPIRVCLLPENVEDWRHRVIERDIKERKYTQARAEQEFQQRGADFVRCYSTHIRDFDHAFGVSRAFGLRKLDRFELRKLLISLEDPLTDLDRPRLNEISLFTYLKIDVAHHSSMVASNPLHLVEERLDDFQNFVETCARSRGGSIWSWQGDGGLLGFYERNQPRAEQAVECAQQVLAGLKEFNLEKPDSPEISVRIAVHRGEARFVEPLGRIHSVAINYVAHLEPHAIAGTLLISGDAYQQLSTRQRKDFALVGSFEGKRVYGWAAAGTPGMRNQEAKELVGLRGLYRNVEHYAEITGSTYESQLALIVKEALPNDTIRMIGIDCYELLQDPDKLKSYLVPESSSPRKFQVIILDPKDDWAILKRTAEMARLRRDGSPVYDEGAGDPDMDRIRKKLGVVENVCRQLQTLGVHAGRFEYKYINQLPSNACVMSDRRALGVFYNLCHKGNDSVVFEADNLHTNDDLYAYLKEYFEFLWRTPNTWDHRRTVETLRAVRA